MGTLALIVLGPLLWPFAAKLIWPHEITLLEILGNLVAGLLVGVLLYYGGMYARAMDVEVLNGLLLSKTSERVSCEHTYSCNCKQVCSGSGKGRSCSASCDICHEHSYDVDWKLQTELGDIKVARTDRRGLAEPSRYTRAQKGDPVAISQRYVNYIKAAPDSLFNAVSETTLKVAYAGKLPEYPADVYDYHYVNRVLAQGLSVPDLAVWNIELAKAVAALGVSKQVNAVVVLTSEASPDYAAALRSYWLGGKKNDVVIVLGTPRYPAIDWVRVFSWTDKELFKVQLRDALQAEGEASPKKIVPLLKSHIAAGFARKPMKDFEYLWHEASLPGWLIALAIVLSMGASIGLSLYFSNNQGYRYKPASTVFFRRKL